MIDIINRSTGPTNLPDKVRETLSNQVISHRSVQFEKLIENITNNLSLMVNSPERPLLLTGSGTAGLDAGISSIVTKSDTILILSAGYYGNLLGAIAKTYCNNIDIINYEPGLPIDGNELRVILTKKSYDIVLMTHSESSTGVLHPIKDIINTIKKYSDALILIDAVSSLGTTLINFKEWDIDLMVSATQKGIMSPPGVAIIFLSERAKKKVISNTANNFYYDLKKYISCMSNFQVPFTPAINTLFGLNTALELIREEKLDNVYNRHNNASKIIITTFDNSAVKLFAKSHHAPGITSLLLPNNYDAVKIQQYLANELNIFISTGLSFWTNNVLRIGHMGCFKLEEISRSAISIRNSFKD
ncbi:MAG: aminotransferase class V-fold PLP-dependent enzyme [Burkholderiales bacterium]|nr:aminotransferase class V-fold PLP-dependent enzyme [Burkholderiales bacterium]